MRRIVVIGIAVAVLLLGGTMRSSSVSASTLPPDAYGVSYEPPLSGAQPMQVTADVARNAAGHSVYVISLQNRSPRMANFVLPLNGSINLKDGLVYQIQGVLQMKGASRPVQASLGYQLLAADGGYLADWAPAAGQYQLAVDGNQMLATQYLGKDASVATRAVPARAQPRLAVYNLAAGRSVSFTFELVQSVQGALSGQADLPGWSRFPESLTPGAVLPLEVDVRLAPGGEAYPTALSLQSASQTYRFEQSLVAATNAWSSMREVWDVRVPSSAPKGTYDVWYELPTLGVKQRLGTVAVSSSAGMAIGFGVHRYPGPSESSLGAMHGEHQFVRSLASDQLYLTQWWQGPDVYDWRALDRWANFHSPDGGRRLVLTFSGSPQWASANPTQAAAMGMSGNAAPPKLAHRDAYARMVAATVQRLKGRLLAVECWNEPDVPAFFSGTQTDLADLCKAVSEQSKAQDPGVKVICPQPTDPVGLDLVYGAKTTAGVPIANYCDWVGSHVYNRLGRDSGGRDYLQDGGVDQAVAAIRGVNQKYGIDKPIAVTEYGVSSCVARPSGSHPVAFGAMPSGEASEAVYRAIRAFRQEGVVALGLYSYDHGQTDAKCVPGGSFVRATVIGSDGKQRLDTQVLDRVTQAVRDFGLND